MLALDDQPVREHILVVKTYVWARRENNQCSKHRKRNVELHKAAVPTVIQSADYFRQSADGKIHADVLNKQSSQSKQTRDDFGKLTLLKVRM